MIRRSCQILVYISKRCCVILVSIFYTHQGPHAFSFTYIVHTRHGSTAPDQAICQAPNLLISPGQFDFSTPELWVADRCDEAVPCPV